MVLYKEDKVWQACARALAFYPAFSLLQVTNTKVRRPEYDLLVLQLNYELKP